MSRQRIVVDYALLSAMATEKGTEPEVFDDVATLAVGSRLFVSPVEIPAQRTGDDR